MIKPVITGSFFDFKHHSAFDGKYWVDKTALFTDEDWKLKIREMKELGIDTVVIMAVSLHGKSFFKSKLFPKYEIKATDALKAVLEQAGELNMNVFVGVGWVTEQCVDYPTEDWQVEKSEKLIKELDEGYGGLKAFKGWYIPYESGIKSYFEELCVDKLEKITRYIKTISKKPVLIAPYVTGQPVNDEKYISQLQRLGVDIVAYQDSIGVRWRKPEDTTSMYKNLKEIHDKTNIKLWTDLEVFEFEGDVYKSGLIPADIERIKKQLVNEAPFVEKILCYQVHGLMDKPGSKKPLGVFAAQKLYADYQKYRKGDATQ
ncbi:MAG: hypothetical protein A2452_00150 [Candidatus Firestonebacteria bacterium RIFOXYC2_FULL_39_67]|nr:MAG: hypothetical protein A2536_05855 [Candidatus Firestonebacteria bacterium RIFOXYD2_FULL_39_29]OGF54221.1 MAG: hypothetical protein A2452_00150 [Candidatus Firestonebacteria bacterium RIFOXYC2_FULL_39_67]